jgi:hypothetical protein
LGPSDLLEPWELGLELFISPQRSRVLKATIVGGLLKREEKVWQVVTTWVDELEVGYMHQYCELADLRHSFLSIAPLV